MALNKVAEKMKSNPGGEGTPAGSIKPKPRLLNTKLKSPIVKEKSSGLVGTGNIGSISKKMKK